MSHLMDQLALDCQYRLAAVTRESAMKSRALNYELEFERSFSRRLERQRLDRKQWQDVILPRIKNEAAMRGVTNDTINHYQAYTKMILSWGADQQLIAFHPWRDFKKLKTAPRVHDVALRDLRTVYAYLPDWLRWAVKTAFFLALRPGLKELFRLEWKAFNFRRGCVTVRQGKTGLLKTVYPCSAYMQEARTRMEMDMAMGIMLVCHNNGSKVYSYHKAWLSACRRAGVRLRFYDIRHIAASEMLARGADLASVAAQLGHTNTNTTGRTYAHVTAGGQEYAGSIMPLLED